MAMCKKILSQIGTSSGVWHSQMRSPQAYTWGLVMENGRRPDKRQPEEKLAELHVLNDVPSRVMIETDSEIEFFKKAFFNRRMPRPHSDSVLPHGNMPPDIPSLYI